MVIIIKKDILRKIKDSQIMYMIIINSLILYLHIKIIVNI